MQRQKANEKLEIRRSEMEMPITELDTIFHTVTEADVLAANKN